MSQHYRNAALLAMAQVEITQSDEYTASDLALPETRLKIAKHSHTFRILTRLADEHIDLSSLQWREFEELIADLLERDGWQVELGKGSKDGGTDIFATRELDRSGLVAAVWQAKAWKNRVGLPAVKELCETRRERGANKGVIATTSFLTRGALEKVTQERFTLGKMERPDVIQWIREVLHDRSV
jgi:restriction system protein